MTHPRSFRPARLAALAALLLSTPLAAQQDQSFALSGSQVLIHNLVGEIQVERTSGRQVEVEVLLRGRDAALLRVERGQRGGRESVDVIFPDDQIVFPGLGHRSSSQISVRGDDWPEAMRGRTVRVSGSGPGVEAHAIVRVRLPAGADAELQQGVGSTRVVGVQGNLTVGARAASVHVSDFAGELRVNSGSGRIEVERSRGDARVRTGSGHVRMSAVQAGRLEVSTGSGGMTLQGIGAEQVTLMAGSGRLDLDDLRARSLTARTGSGRIDARLASMPTELSLNTGSGGVRLALARGAGAEFTIQTGSGSIHMDLPTRTLSSGRSHLRATTGDGSGRVSIRTGSGGVRVSQI